MNARQHVHDSRLELCSFQVTAEESPVRFHRCQKNCHRENAFSQIVGHLSVLLASLACSLAARQHVSYICDAAVGTVKTAKNSDAPADELDVRRSCVPPTK